MTVVNAYNISLVLQNITCLQMQASVLLAYVYVRVI